MIGQLASASIYGLLNGGLYALVAAGLSLIYGVMGLVNFAHGELLMLAMFAAYWLCTLLGMDPYLTLFIVVPIMFLIGIAIQEGLINRVSLDLHTEQIVLTLGLSIFLVNLAVLLWSPDYRLLESKYTAMVLDLPGTRIAMPRVIAFLASIALVFALYRFLKGTKLGTMIRATAQDRVAAGLMQINPRFIYALVFGISAACTGVGGVLISTHLYTHPGIGGLFVLLCFVIVVLGGIGSIRGALIGGLLIGWIESVSAVFIPPSLKATVYFALFLIILWVRPLGLLGSKL